MQQGVQNIAIVDVQADINDFDRDFLSASKARELSVLSDVDSGQGEDAHSESTGARGMDFVSSSPLFSTTPPLFSKFS